MSIAQKLRLGVNVDHVATLRNARGGAVPDPLRAAQMALAAGADGITAHLREDRRHIHDEDMARLKASIGAPLNFEMAATEQMLDIALKIQPHACCLVPEKRTERTTEGGLDVIGGKGHLAPFIDELLRGKIRVSLFIEPSFEALAAAAALRAPVVELHTGAWCHAVEQGETGKADAEFERLRLAAAEAAQLGLECHAGHGLDFATARKIAALAAGGRVEHRPFPDRRSHFHRPRRQHPQDARGHGSGAKGYGGGRVIVGSASISVTSGGSKRRWKNTASVFPNRCFTEIERAKADGRAARAATYAKRFAAKEACAKALGTGLGRGIDWLDMGVVNDALGRPALHLTGAAAARLASLIPSGCEAHVHLTLTDEYPLAQAQVIIEARQI